MIHDGMVDIVEKTHNLKASFFVPLIYVYHTYFLWLNKFQLLWNIYFGGQNSEWLDEKVNQPTNIIEISNLSFIILREKFTI